MTSEAQAMGHGAPWRIVGWSAAGALLLLPLAAMQVTDEVRWTGFDFAFFGAMLAGVGGAFELVARRSGNWAYRGGAATALFASFLLVMANGAVGLIGSERDAANLLFGLVLLVALGGAILVRFRPTGMARAMLTTAAVQVAVPLAIWAGRLTSVEPVRAWDVAMTIGLFTPLWLGAAALFRRADVR